MNVLATEDDKIINLAGRRDFRHLSKHGNTRAAYRISYMNSVITLGFVDPDAPFCPLCRKIAQTWVACGVFISQNEFANETGWPKDDLGSVCRAIVDSCVLMVYRIPSSVARMHAGIEPKPV